MTTQSSNDDNLERSSAWVLTCESWMAQGAYIVLPVNPTSLNFDLGVRTSNELARATNMIYVWRHLAKSSMLVKPVIHITASSGYIVPSFDPSIILEAREVAADLKTTMENLRGQGLPDPDAEDRQEQEDQKAQLIANTKAQYDALMESYGAHMPQPEQTKDYITGGVYKKVGLALKANPALTDTGNSGYGNLPNLYTEENKHVPIGVQNLYALFSLADERRIRKTSENSKSQTENRVMLVLSTMVFPRLVVYGWFGESGISYTESAEDPHSFDVSFDIVVTETVPALSYGKWNDLVNTYRLGIADTGTTLDYAQAAAPNGTVLATPTARR